MDKRIGQQLGNYRLTRLLGQGGFSDVYLGEHVHLNTQAALKILQMRLVGSNLEAFRNEARTVATLAHPHIVRILDFGVEDGAPFLVMDYASHGSLRERYPSGSILPPAQLVSYVKQVASALHYAHQKKLIHRDIKPENMLLGADENLLLSDFGLVLVAQSSSSQITREAAGTVPYMAPEQLQGKPRPASDQYSLAIVVYEWLCGERPFKGGSVEIMGQQLLMPPPPLRQKVSTIPATVEEVVLKALAKDPQERFASVEEFARHLEVACPGGMRPSSASLDQSAIATYISPSPANLLADVQSQGPTRLNTPVQPAAYSDASTYVRTPSQPPDELSSTHQPSLSDLSSGPTHQLVTPSHPVSSTDISPVQPPTNSNTQLSPAAPVSTHLTPDFPTYISSSPHLPISSTPTIPSSSPNHIAPITPIVGVPLSPPPALPPSSSRRSRSRLWLIAILLLLILLIGSVITLNFSLPGGILSLLSHNGGSGSPGTLSATVTITPTSQDVKDSYLLTGTTGTPDASQRQVQAHLLTSTNTSQPTTVATTGQGTKPAKQATGTLEMMSFDASTQNFPAGTTFNNEAGRASITMVLDADVVLPPSGDITVPGRVAQAGSAGNIAVGDFCSPVCGASPGGYYRVTNSTSFTGGQDAQTYQAVAQSDIDGAANPLISTLTSSAQNAVQQQVTSSQRAVGSPKCSPQINSDHHVGDQATSVTVTVTVTCTLESYDYQAAQTLAEHLLGQRAASSPGSSYALTGKIVTTLTSATITDASNNTITITLSCEGIWVFQFTDAQQQALKSNIAGKSKSAALAWLTSQPGIKHVNIQSSGETLPTNGSTIMLTIQKVPGAGN